MLFEDLEYAANVDAAKLEHGNRESKRLLQNAEEATDEVDRIYFRGEAERLLREAKHAGQQLAANLELLGVLA